MNLLPRIIPQPRNYPDPSNTKLGRPERFVVDNSFPTFRVMDVVREKSRVSLQGDVSSIRVGRETWVGDQYLGYLKHGAFLAPGRWEDRSGVWSFVFDRPDDLAELEGTSEFEVLDGYWGERAELVLDRSTTWNHEKWVDTADHDHCVICWATIATFEHDDYFAGSSGDRVCVPCYRNYVSQRALGFIPSAAQQGDAADNAPRRR